MKNFFIKLKRKIKYFLFPSINRLSKKFRFNLKCGTLIKSILENNGIDISRIHFTDITAKSYKKEVIIKCTMLRPGLFIGRQGRTFDMLKEYLEDYFNKKVKIFIYEKWLWN